MNTETSVVDVRVVEVLKNSSTAPPNRLRIQLSSPAGLIQMVKTEQPVVVFVGGAEGNEIVIFHLTDQWLLAQPLGGRKDLWRVSQRYDAAKGFPGRTASLVRLVRELKAGRVPMDDEIEPLCLQGPVREVARFAMKDPAFLLPVRVDSRTAFLVGAEQKVRLLVSSGREYLDLTTDFGLQDARAMHAATGDINGDGRDDLLLGSEIWFREQVGFRFSGVQLEVPPETAWLAIAVADVSEDKREDVVLLTRSGELLVLHNPGPPFVNWQRKERRLWREEKATAACFSCEWGEDGKLSCLVVTDKGIFRYSILSQELEPATLRELTGIEKLDLPGGGGLPLHLENFLVLDFDGNNRLDVMFLTGDSGVTLFNRGFGAFLPEYTAHLGIRPQPPKKLPFQVNRTTRFAPSPRCSGAPPRPNLFVLTSDGVLYEVAHEGSAE
ncbi:MAG: VCBS repeat-containing protein [Kiritimatiellae bacterium]|nr:VCBS repeat-containing protein [Kiritimatiellia bacterium]